MSDYTPHTKSDIKSMLDVIGIKDIQDLYKGIPILNKDLDLKEGKTQQEVEKEFIDIANQNKQFRIILRGAGAYNHYIPAAVSQLAQREEFVTAYTPYQAELSQGILQAMFEYQTMICYLTDMDVSNASVYDGATAVADAIVMCTSKNKNKVVFSSCVNPEIVKVSKTYLKNLDIKFSITQHSGYKTLKEDLLQKVDDKTGAVVIAQPNYYGSIEDEQVIKTIIDMGIDVIMYVNPIAQAILKTPGELGASVAVGEGQSLGLPLNFGGPYLGFMATTKKNMRKLPGRIVGQTLDSDNNKVYVLTLQAREQHIRREKAQSNICSNQAHCALQASMYMSALGKQGIKQVANICMSNAHYFASQLQKIGFSILNDEFFNEFVTESKINSTKIINTLAKHNILAGLKLDKNKILWCTTEMNDINDFDLVVDILKKEVLA